MKKSYFYRAPSYVVGTGELFFMSVVVSVMFWIALIGWRDLVEVPPSPERVILRSAYFTQPLIISKSSAFFI